MRRYGTGPEGFGGRRARIAAALLALVFAGGALLAPAASASEPGMFPAYATCVKLEKIGKKYAGGYTDNECMTPATAAEQQEGKHNRYERREVSAGPFEAASRHGATIATHGMNGTTESVVCKKGLVRGAFEESDVYASQKMIFEKCFANGEKSDPCGSQNKGAEEIESQPLFSALVWLSGPRTEPGILLEAEGEQVARFKCGSERVDLEGYLVGAIEDTKKGHTITFALSASGQQAHRSAWLFASEVPRLALYTQDGKAHLEATLQAVEEQPGTGVY